MLIYHPLTDLYHALNRCLIIIDYAEKSDNKSIDIERYRIYDYYLLFPNDIRNTSLPTEFRGFKKIKFENKYNIVKNRKTVFKRLRNIQDMCINNLISHNIVNSKMFIEKKVLTLNEEYTKVDFIKTDLDYLVLDLFSNYFDNISLRSLKERTKLTQHRYEHS